ncbi:MAG TPA: DUF6544 family protein [Polyangiaceae bacterium]|nr:DUF6544 family protein [Polyangiaceae bacterium]
MNERALVARFVQSLRSMGWLVLMSALTLFGAAGVVVNVNQLRLRRLVAQEMQALIAVAPSSTPRPALGHLPPPVARYHELALGDRAAVHTLALRHVGTFRISATAKPLPIRGTQLFTSDPPGFVWVARVQMFPGLWVDARDMAANGKGTMRVLLDSTVSIADAHGPELDQGSALRLLAEMVWYPTALFDARYVTWSAIDELHALATLRFGEHLVSGTFEFGADGLPVGMTAQRSMDKLGLRPWGGTYRDWRNVSGMRVPFEATVTWQLESGPFTYAHWLIETMAYDVTKP